jgi:hypothetical protein
MFLSNKQPYTTPPWAISLFASNEKAPPLELFNLTALSLDFKA